MPILGILILVGLSAVIWLGIRPFEDEGADKIRKWLLVICAILLVVFSLGRAFYMYIGFASGEWTREAGKVVEVVSVVGDGRHIVVKEGNYDYVRLYSRCDWDCDFSQLSPGNLLKMVKADNGDGNISFVLYGRALSE